MSYCVNCGVELANTEKHCPLCHVEVINPKEPWQEPAQRPYSHHVDKIMKRIDRRYFAALAGMLLIIPCVITLLLDMLSDGTLTWSAYVLGGIALAYLFVLLPFYFKKRHTVIYILVDCVATVLYLFFIETMNEGNWFLGMGLPLAAAASVCVIVLVLFFLKKKPRIFVRIGAVLITIGVFVVYAEVFISRNALNALRIVWSPYALIPCVVLGVAALVLGRRQTFKEQIRRRLFY